MPQPIERDNSTRRTGVARKEGGFIVFVGQVSRLSQDSGALTKIAAPSTAENRLLVGQTLILPHPDPLPLGEGKAIARQEFSRARPTSSGASNLASRTAILPLPAGEGWGEGEP